MVEEVSGQLIIMFKLQFDHDSCCLGRQKFHMRKAPGQLKQNQGDPHQIFQIFHQHFDPIPSPAEIGLHQMGLQELDHTV